MAQRATERATSYEVDFYRWTQETAELVCRGEFDDIDREHLAVEIADLGKRDKREVRSRVTVLLMHLLKWQMQPQRRARSSRRATIVEQRRQLALVLADSPSLYQIARNELQPIYHDAVEDAAAQSRSPVQKFPRECPFSLEQILDTEFLP